MAVSPPQAVHLLALIHADFFGGGVVRLVGLVDDVIRFTGGALFLVQHILEVPFCDGVVVFARGFVPEIANLVHVHFTVGIQRKTGFCIIVHHTLRDVRRHACFFFVTRTLGSVAPAQLAALRQSGPPRVGSPHAGVRRLEARSSHGAVALVVRLTIAFVRKHRALVRLFHGSIRGHVEAADGPEFVVREVGTLRIQRRLNMPHV